MISKAAITFNNVFGQSPPPPAAAGAAAGGKPGGTKNVRPEKQFNDDQIVERAMAADNLVEHGLVAIDKQVSIMAEIINLSEGRDKIFKIFSSLLKITRWVVTKYFSHFLASKEILSRLKGCSSATSTARAFLKLFTDFVFFRLAMRVYRKQRFGWLKILTLIRLVGLGFYFSFNVPVWLHITKLAPNLDKTWWGKLSLVAYIISTSAQFAMDFKKLYDLTSEIGYLNIFAIDLKHAAANGATSSASSAGAGAGAGAVGGPSQLVPSALRRYQAAVAASAAAPAPGPEAAADAAAATTQTVGAAGAGRGGYSNMSLSLRGGGGGSAINDDEAVGKKDDEHEEEEEEEETDDEDGGHHSPRKDQSLSSAAAAATATATITTGAGTDAVAGGAGVGAGKGVSGAGKGPGGLALGISPMRPPGKTRVLLRSSAGGHSGGYWAPPPTTAATAVGAGAGCNGAGCDADEEKAEPLSLNTSFPSAPSTGTAATVEAGSGGVVVPTGMKTPDAASPSFPQAAAALAAAAAAAAAAGAAASPTTAAGGNGNGSGNDAAALRGRVRKSAYAAVATEAPEASAKAVCREAELRRARMQLLVNFIKDGGDFLGAFNGVFDWGWSDLTNGLLGVNSGCISLYRLWRRYADTVEKKIAERRRQKAKTEAEERSRLAALEAMGYSRPVAAVTTTGGV